MVKSTIPLFFSWRSAFQKSDLPSTTKLVLFCISTYMNDHGGGCFPSIKTLMVDSSLSNTAVITHIKKAQDAGFLTVGSHGFSGQGWKRNEYHMAFADSKKVVNLTIEGGEPNDKKVVKEVHTNTPLNTPKNKKYIKDFEELFIAYGKVGNRKLSMVKYEIARRTVDQETLLKAIKLYDAHLKAEDWKQKRSLQAWLHQEAWTEEYKVKYLRKSWSM